MTDGLPQVDAERIFNSSESLVRMHSALVQVSKLEFLIIGHWREGNRDKDINSSLLKIKPSTLWRGEVAAFVISTHVPLLYNPRIKGKVYDRAVCR
jgi:hypothetical protein